MQRVLFNDPNEENGFLLSVDTKWKSHPPCVVDADARDAWRGHDAVRDLYCLAICHRRDVHSLRDLRTKHLPLLRRILAVGTATVRDVYACRPTPFASSSTTSRSFTTSTSTLRGCTPTSAARSSGRTCCTT